MPLTPGFRLGPYEVVGPIGAGGMGEVYRARDSRLGRDVALKILPDTFTQDPDRVARFQREAETLAALNHPHIASIYGLEEAPSTGSGPVGIRALVLELVEGPTLADLIQAKGQGPKAQESDPHLGPGPKARGLPLSDALPIARQIIDALEAAHEKGIVHRDLKPANVKVRPDGAVKVLDFGLAKALAPAGALGAASATSALTMTSPAMTGLGMILGTAAYMAPEQAKGREIDTRADVWAFGCVLFEMLTGRATFDGDDVADTLANILKVEPDWAALPASTPRALVAVLRRCLKKDPRERYRDIGDVRLAIDDAMAAAAEAPGAAASAVRARAPWWPLALAGALALALVAAAPFAITHLREVPPPAPATRFALPPPPNTRFPTSTVRANVSISPDGRFIVFRATRPGGAPGIPLWIRPLATLEARELPGTDNAVVPIWSPDSKSIAFLADGKLKRLEIAGGPVQTLCEVKGLLGATWNREGTILFSDPLAGGLFRIRSAGGSVTPVRKQDPAKREAFIGPQFLPDGRRFLFTVMPGSHVFLGSLDGNDATPVVDPGDIPLLADGFLLYLRQGSLMAHPFDEVTGRVTGDPVPIAERVEGSTPVMGGSVAIASARQNVLAYQSWSEAGGGRAVWLDRHGREAGPGPTGSTAVEYPRLSPDGKRLAVTVQGELWVYDLQGRPPIRITFDGGPYYSPLWTPDGRRLLVEPVTSSSDDPVRAYEADGSTSKPTPASGAGHFHPWGWLDRGQELLAVALGGVPTAGNDLLAIRQDGKFERRAVVATPFNDGASGAAVSADGRWIAYSSNATGETEIWIRPAAGSGAAVRVSPKGGFHPVWSRTTSELFYLEPAVNEIVVVSVVLEPGTELRFKPPVRLFQTATFRSPQPQSWDVAPDGRFLFLKPIGEGANDPGAKPLTVIMNWKSVLGR